MKALWQRFGTPVLVLLLALAIVVTLTRKWNAWEGKKVEQDTNDAYVRRDLTPLSTKVAGLVRAVKVERGDTVIISAKPIPGNELRIHDTINGLTKLGAEVLHEDNAPVHVSGHANADELRTIIALLRPRAVMPVHGEYRMLAAHARLAQEAGVPANSIILGENGAVVELEPGRSPRIVEHVEAGVTFVDGLGVGDVKDVALRDRRHLSEDGVLIVVATLATNGSVVAGPPELIARGFAESGPLLDEMRDEARQVLETCVADNVDEIKLLQEHLHDGIGQLVYDRTGRRPMILRIPRARRPSCVR